MIALNKLSNASRGTANSKRVGRGPGSKKGKTCGRGIKGAGSRSGYKRRHGREGGQTPLFQKMPHRGFSRGRFLKPTDMVNLGQIEFMYEDGETVNAQTLREKGFLSGPLRPLKILGEGELTKKVAIEADAASASAKKQIEEKGIQLTLSTQA